MSRHALMLLSNGYTYDGRVRREVQSLVAAGHRVTVLAWDRDGTLPPEEQLDGARIIRLRTTRRMRAFGYDLFRLPLLWRRLAAVGRRVHGADPIHLVHAHDLDTLPAGTRIKRTCGVPLVYDAHEVWTYMIARDVPRVFVMWFERLERRHIRHVDVVLTVGERYKEHLDRIAPSPARYVMNAKPPQVDAYEPPADGPFRVVYIGTMNDSRRVLECIEAVRGMDDVVLELAGMGPATYLQQVERSAAEAPNVTFLGRIPQEEVLPRTLAAHAVLCIFSPDDQLTRIGMPNKLFEALATGRPLIASRGTYLGEFVEAHGVGIAVTADAEGIREGIRALAAEPRQVARLGARAVALGHGEYSWAAQEAVLLDTYRELLDRKGRSGRKANLP